MKVNLASIALAVLGIIVLILAIVLGFVVFPNTVENKVKDQLRLVRGTDIWNKWVDIDSPIYISFYIFNVLNPDQVEDGSEAPKLQEVGPYVYRQRRQKIDAHTEDCKEIVTYEQKYTYWFNQEKSGNRTEKDLVDIINVPFVSVMSKLAKGVAAGQLPADAIDYYSNSVLRDESLIRRRVEVGELLFKGFDVSNFDHFALTPLLPEEFSGFRFGLYKGRNQSTDGVYQVYTGAKSEDSGKFGIIKTWNGLPSLSYWGSDECNKLTGTDGSIFPPFIEEEDTITIFNTDLCRLLPLKFKEKVEVKDLEGFRFSPPKEALQGAANNPANQCYCLDGADCKDGIVDVGVCRNGAPIILSTPYFLDGFDGFRQAVGLAAADRSKHETIIDIEPRTGLLLQAHKRIQINVDVPVVPGSNQLGVLKEKILFPAMWLDEEASICDMDVDDFKSRIEKPIKTVTIIRWVAIGVGIVLVLIAIAIPFVCKRKSVNIA